MRCAELTLTSTLTQLGARGSFAAPARGPVRYQRARGDAARRTDAARCRPPSVIFGQEEAACGDAADKRPRLLTQGCVYVATAGARPVKPGPIASLPARDPAEQVPSPDIE
jgi:hypothetical protein